MFKGILATPPQSYVYPQEIAGVPYDQGLWKPIGFP